MASSIYRFFRHYMISNWVNEGWFNNSVLRTMAAQISVVQTCTWVNQASFDNVVHNVSNPFCFPTLCFVTATDLISCSRFLRPSVIICWADHMLYVMLLWACWVMLETLTLSQSWVTLSSRKLVSKLMAKKSWLAH